MKQNPSNDISIMVEKYRSAIVDSLRRDCPLPSAFFARKFDDRLIGLLINRYHQISFHVALLSALESELALRKESRKCRLIVRTAMKILLIHSW